MLISLVVLLALQISPKDADPAIAELRSKDQQLLDAIAPGDRKLWDHLLAENAVYVDENGAILKRSEFLQQLDPLPAAVSGNIRITEYSASISGDLATVIHTDDEQETYHGEKLSARYLTTETWRREGGEWKLHLIHTYSVLQDPPAVSLPAESLRQYEGRYVSGTDLVYLIQWDGKQLMGGRAGKTMSPLLVEARDVLFVAGQPRVRKIFQRDPSGNVLGFADRREGRDLVWRRALPHS
jgi:uncharacterized protein DUF4440